jgi:sugar O-acyltransferase (sialic acid O-acetyltransferase NeuD family)
MNEKIFLLGAGGHASVLVDALKQHKINISATYGKEQSISRKVLADIPLFEDENDIFNYNCKKVSLVNGIGSLPSSTLRIKLYNKFSERGYSFLQVISKHAYISSFATLGKGVQVMPGAIIQAGAVIGDNTIINSGAIVEHDCIINKHCHIAPGVTLSGQVTIGHSVHIGTGANIIQNITVGDNAIVGAGANIFNNVAIAETVFGARTKHKSNE